MVATRGDMPATRRKALKLPSSIIPKKRVNGGVKKAITKHAGLGAKLTPTQSRTAVRHGVVAGKGATRRNLSKAFNDIDSSSAAGHAGYFSEDSTPAKTPRKRQRPWRGRRKRKSPVKATTMDVEAEPMREKVPVEFPVLPLPAGATSKVGNVLKEEDVIEIFCKKPQDKSDRARITRELCSKFPCSKYTIRDIWNMRSWVSVTSTLTKQQRKRSSGKQKAGKSVEEAATPESADDASISNADTVGSPSKDMDEDDQSSSHSFSSPSAAATNTTDPEDEGFTTHSEIQDMPNSVSDPFQSSPCGYKIIPSDRKPDGEHQPYAIMNRTFDNKDCGTKAGTVVIQPNAHYEFLAQKSAYMVYICQGEGRAAFSLVEESGDGPSTPPLPCGSQEVTENHMINLKRGTGVCFSNSSDSVDLCIVWFSNKLGPVARRR